MRRVKSIEEVFWKLFATFSVIKPKEKKSKTAGGAVKQHQDGTCDAAKKFVIPELVEKHNQYNSKGIVIRAQKYGKQNAGNGNNEPEPG